jgi:putative adhesin
LNVRLISLPQYDDVELFFKRNASLLFSSKSLEKISIMNKLKTTLILVAICLSTVAFGQKTINKSYTGVKSIRLETASGSGTIKKSSTNEVKVTLEYTYDDEDYEPQFEQRGDRLIIDEDFNNRGRNWSNRGKAEWTLELPDGVELDYSSGSGSIEVDGLDIELNVGTGSGSIEVNDVTGRMKINTGSGSIRISKTDGELDANTGSGSIRLRDSKGDADLNTGSGSIRVEQVEGSFDLNTGSGSIEATGITINGDSDFNTGSGRVEIELAADLNYDLDINTGSGSATLDFNGTEVAGEFYLETDKRRSDITAPFSFDKEYERDGRGRDNVRQIKEAKVGSKSIRINMETGSGDVKIRN